MYPEAFCDKWLSVNTAHSLIIINDSLEPWLGRQGPRQPEVSGKPRRSGSLGPGGAQEAEGRGEGHAAAEETLRVGRCRLRSPSVGWPGLLSSAEGEEEGSPLSEQNEAPSVGVNPISRKRKA